jgi:hypothetical protein
MFERIEEQIDRTIIFPILFAASFSGTDNHFSAPLLRKREISIQTRERSAFDLILYLFLAFPLDD